MQDYKKLKVWELGHELTLMVYQKTSTFPKEEMFGLTSQIRRASSSIPTNIAEGCGRYSSKELTQFLNISLGSANETSYLLFLAKDLNYLTNEDFENLNNQIEQIKAMLINLISKIKNV
ncbi:four helix bundle protein [Faecalibacter rhinopitheci]|uniref:Four helix bundle protein n=1 Tax=Faecalibacter rhinopitheci TaxID=2779678 RepID=A0A8J7G9S3_9FLAO|nr:four helix bundle protein [Faecalibacter rhinopitheci]MBF0598130.1 four helix bundle protein [Faecalibacter rhinopitheci]MBQ0147321.1 four helix bundle protein [Candidatus Onthonaster equi]